MEAFYLQGLKASVFKRGERFNFSDILDYVARTDSVTPKKEKNRNPKKLPVNSLTTKDVSAKLSLNYQNPIPELPVRLKVANIRLTGIALSYKDLKTGIALDVQKTKVVIPEISLKKLDISNVNATFPLFHSLYRLSFS